jgi:sulfite exporter TauE/SafE
VWRTAVASVVVVTLLALLASLAGWSRLSSGVGDLEAGGLVVVLLLGLAAGVSTCMALTGGIVLAVSAANAARMQRLNPGATPSLLQRLRPVLVFNGGRIVGFTALGAVLGLLGASVTIPTQVLAVMMLTVAVVMLVLGVRLTEVSPRISGWTIALPASWGQRMGLDQKATRGYSDLRTALLGAATFFLPCGFTQAAQVFALSTGSPGYAALIMGTFALGTAPGLLTLGGLPELLPVRGRTGMLRGLGVLVLLFALVNGAAGLRLAGIDPLHPFGVGVGTPTTATANVDVSTDVQVLHMQQVTDGYLPVRSVVYSGVPIRWVIDSADPQSCAVFLRAPALGVAVTLKKGPNTIELPAQEPGTIPFSCSMGMYGGSITVVAPPTASSS